MDTPLKVFVGTDPHMRKAELALEYSIRKYCSVPVDIIWMDFARGGVWANWNVGRPRGLPYSGQGWSTDFTCFRFAIPEANHYQGRAVYLDVDMILLRDIKELFELPMSKPVVIPKGKFDVILYDCAAFKNFDWWPKISQMKPSGWTIKNYLNLLLEKGVIADTMPDLWDCYDGAGYEEGKTGLVHYTNMHTQPWKPYPERFDYPPHPRPDMVELWMKLYQEAEAEQSNK